MLQDRGITLVLRMTVAMMISVVFSSTSDWPGPETHGGKFDLDHQAAFAEISADAFVAQVR